MRKILIIIYSFVPLLTYSQSITSVNNYSLNPFDTIVINGSGFNTTSNSVLLFLGNANVKPLSIASTRIKFLAPNYITHGKITYIDTSNKKVAYSNFNIQISTVFKKSPDIIEDFFKQEKNVNLSTPLNGSCRLQLMDCDNDGIEELLVSTKDFVLSIYANKSTKYNTSFIKVADLKKRFISSIVAINDLNQDGKLDLITGNNNYDTIRYWINTTKNGKIAFRDTFFIKISVGMAQSFLDPLEIVDFNGDGRSDLCVETPDPTSPAFFLTKKGTSTAVTVKSVLPGSSILSINNMYAINLNNDSLTDLMAYPNLGNGVLFFKNISKGDTIRFIKVDSFFNTMYYLVNQLDFNKDNIKDFMFVNRSDGKSIKILINNSIKDSIRLKEMKTNLTVPTRQPLFWDYNFDSIPDVVYTAGNVICKTLTMKKDSLVSKSSNLTTNTKWFIQAIRDINFDNRPDLICGNIYSATLDILLGNEMPYTLGSQTFSYFADSVNHVFYDSIQITNKALKDIIIDSFFNNQEITFYNSAGYITAPQFPIKISVNSSKKIYFKKKYTADRSDTMWFNDQKIFHAGIVTSKYVIPCAYVKSIDRITARPGDTITIRGNYFFSKLTDISIRMGNRRCKVLNNSKDTTLKFIYPSLTQPFQILITDTFKHYNTYSRHYIFPTFKGDTGTNFNKKSFQTNELAISEATNVNKNIYELPTGLNTGYPVAVGGCYSGAAYDWYIGKVELKTRLTPFDYKGCKVKIETDPPGYYGEKRMADFNADGMLDYYDIWKDTLGIYFCKNITDTSIEYASRKKILVQNNAYNIKTLSRSYLDFYDLDKDGTFEIIKPASTNDDTLFYLSYDITLGKLIVKSFYCMKPNTFVYQIGDFTNDGKADILVIKSGFSNYRYSLIENKSTRGAIRFADEEKVLIGSSFSTSLVFNQQYLNNDANLDLIVMDDLYKEYKVYLSDSVNGSKYKLLDSFRVNDPFYKYADIDGDGKPELIGNNIYKFKIKNGRFVITKLDLDNNINFKTATIADVDGDNKPDFHFGSLVYFNCLHDAKFKDNKIKAFETDMYNTTVTDSLYIYNSGTRNINLKNLILNDTNFTVLGKNKLPVSLPLLIKSSDSAKLYILFNPKTKPKKYFTAKLTATLAEDAPVIAKEFWGYVNIPPVISKVLPDFVIAGDTAAIIGKNFDNLKSTPIVAFDNTRAEIIGYDDTLILVKVPFGGLRGVITVYDTATDLQCFSPSPIQYSFIGTSGKINKYSFKPYKFNLPNKFFYLRDYDSDGLPDILMDKYSGSYFDGSVMYKNRSTKNNFNFNGLAYCPFTNKLEYVQLFKDFNGDGVEERVSWTCSDINCYTSSSYIKGSYIQYNHYIYQGKTYGGENYSITDMNGNGKPEIVFGSYAPQTGIYEYNYKTTQYGLNCGVVPDLTFGKLTYLNKTKGSSLYPYDFDGDGKSELLSIRDSIRISFNLSNKDSFHFGNSVSLGTTEFVGVTDMDNDGKLDVVTKYRNTGGSVQYIIIHKNKSTKGNLVFAQNYQYYTSKIDLQNYLLIQDFNGDAKPDMAAYTYPLSDSVVIITNLSKPTAIDISKFDKIRVPGIIRLIQTADMDADSKNDLVLRTDSGIYILRNTNISGYLSRKSYTYSNTYGFPLSVSLGLYSTGGDTLIVDKIVIPPHYILVNSGGSFNLGSFSGIGHAGVNTPIKIKTRDSFIFNLQIAEGTKPGKYIDTILFYNNESAEPYKFIISGEVKPAPLAYLNKKAIDFGKVKINRIASDSFYLKNIGYDTLKIMSVSLNDTVNFKLSFSKNPKDLLMGDSIICYLKFLGNKKDSHLLSIKFNHNDYLKESTIWVSSECIEPFIIDSLNVDFKDVYVSDSIEKVIYLKNTGTDTLEIKDISINSSDGFSFKSNKNKHDSILPKDSMKLTVKFKPDSIKIYSAKITIAHNYAQQNSHIYLSGNGAKSKLTPTNYFIDFGKLITNKNYSFDDTLYNMGNKKLKIKSLLNTNSIFKHALCSVTPDSIDVKKSRTICTLLKHTKKGVFYDTLKIMNNGIDPIVKWYFKAEFVQPLPTISASKNTIDFGDARIGKTKTDIIELYNFSSDTQEIYLSDIKNPFDNLNKDNPKTFYPNERKMVNISFTPLSIGHYSDTMYLTNVYDDTLGYIILRGNNPALGLSRKSIDFGNVGIGVTKTDSFELSNSGNDTLNIYLSGVKTPFTNLNNQNPQTLNPGITKTIGISFKPMNFDYYSDTMYATNIYNDTLDYIIIKGKSSSLSISKSLIDFGDVNVWKSKTDSFELYNPSKDTFEVFLSKVKTPFINLNNQNPKTLYPGSRESVNVSFSPLFVNYYSDTIFIRDALNFNLGSVILNGNSTFSSNKTIFTSNNVKIYPNPTNGIFNLLYPSPNANSSIELYNAIGVLIYKTEITKEISTINLSNYVNGIYIVKVRSDNNLIVAQKLIKQ